MFVMNKYNFRDKFSCSVSAYGSGSLFDELFLTI